MNQRDSSGLPLRAMVMVLLFLGVAFLLIAFQYMGSDGEDDADSVAITATTTSSPTSSAEPSPEPQARDAEVRVFNTSDIAGAAEGTANRLREDGWNVTETGNLVLEGLPATTVFFGEEPGEQEAAEEVGRLLEAPVEPRRPELVEQPPGVIVAVTG
ncbi:LytR C-terminal domain-containing protein [Mycobacterium sp. NPDC003323]